MRGAAGSLAAAALGPLAWGQDAKRPNVLFIAIDDLNDWVGCMGGNPRAITPNIDRLAAKGLLFTNAHCAAPACNPSRASLMTSIRPSTSGVYLNSNPWRPVMPEAVTLTQHFMQNGYQAIGRGKIFHGSFPDAASWNEYTKKGGDPKPPHKPMSDLKRTGHFDWGALPEDETQMDDYKVATWGAEFLGQEHDAPFFLATGFFKPHLPWYAPQKYFDMHPLDTIQLPNVKDDDLDDIPEAGRKMAKPQGDHRKVTEAHEWKKAVQAYLACGTFVDEQVGRVIDALENGPNRDNTIICLWTDHGWHLGEKLHWRKFALWEEATRTPLIFVAPGVTKPGTRCSRPVSLLDIYPTLSQLCGLPIRPECEGRSLTALLKNPDGPRKQPAVTTHGFKNHSVRTEDWRYIQYADGSEELYDEKADPMEWTNLADKPEFAAKKVELAKWLPEINTPEAPRAKGKEKKKKKKTAAAACVLESVCDRENCDAGCRFAQSISRRELATA